MTRTVPKAVFFDLGETLVTQNIEDNLVTRKALERISTELPVGLGPDELFKLYQKGYRHNQPIRTTHNIEIPISSWMRELLRYSLKNEPSIELVERAARIVAESRASYAVEYRDARSVLEAIKGRIKIAVVSNVSSHEAAHEILKRVGFDDYIDSLVTSAQTGIRKPDPGIFFFALKQLGVAPHEVVHVGDHPRNDVGGASTLGIKTVLVIRRTGQETAYGEMRPNLTLDNLGNLVPYLLSQNRLPDDRHA